MMESKSPRMRLLKPFAIQFSLPSILLPSPTFTMFPSPLTLLQLPITTFPLRAKHKSTSSAISLMMFSILLIIINRSILFLLIKLQLLYRICHSPTCMISIKMPQFIASSLFQFRFPKFILFQMSVPSQTDSQTEKTQISIRAADILLKSDGNKMQQHKYNYKYVQLHQNQNSQYKIPVFDNFSNDSLLNSLKKIQKRKKRHETGIYEMVSTKLLSDGDGNRRSLSKARSRKNRKSITRLQDLSLRDERSIENSNRRQKISKLICLFDFRLKNKFVNVYTQSYIQMNRKKDSENTKYIKSVDQKEIQRRIHNLRQQSIDDSRKRQAKMSCHPLKIRKYKRAVNN